MLLFIMMIISFFPSSTSVSNSYLEQWTGELSYDNITTDVMRKLNFKDKESVYWKENPFLFVKLKIRSYKEHIVINFKLMVYQI